MISLQLDSPDDIAAMPGTSTPTQIRDIEHIRADIVRLIEVERLTEARTLANHAAGMHPGEEIAWVMLALVCEVQQDWTGARHALEQAVQLQFPAVSAGVYFHYVRVLRCLGETQLADDVLFDACTIWPEDPNLQQEFQNRIPLPVFRHNIST